MFRGIARAPRLDPGVRALHRAADAAVPPGTVRDLAQGRPIGHPLHPALTDLPIGCWTSAWVLDLVGGPAAARSAQLLIGLGCLAAGPTAVAGLADWTARDPDDQRVGVVHAIANLLALGCYVASWSARRRGSHGAGVVLGMMGAGAATVGGVLGGHLAFGMDS
jgi:uncharacterized membrane protein